MNPRQILQAVDYAREGASIQMLVSLLGLSDYSSRKIAESVQLGKASEHTKLRPTFLNSPAIRLEAMLWLSVVRRMEHGRCQDWLLSAYRTYVSLSCKPMSINHCYGICLAVTAGQFSQTPCELSGVPFVTAATQMFGSPFDPKVASVHDVL
jgi:hypothetical protein